jgi:hypothetical protein
MAEYQLPPLKNERKFEEFICDLFNETEKAEGSDHIQQQLLGVKGQQQKIIVHPLPVLIPLLLTPFT